MAVTRADQKCNPNGNSFELEFGQFLMSANFTRSQYICIPIVNIFLLTTEKCNSNCTTFKLSFFDFGKDGPKMGT